MSYYLVFTHLPGHVIKEINPPLMSTKHAASSVSPLAKRILDELILECTSKTKKVTIPGPAMEEQSSAGKFYTYTN